jgi:hypothetical protein
MSPWQSTGVRDVWLRWRLRTNARTDLETTQCHVDDPWILSDQGRMTAQGRAYHYGLYSGILAKHECTVSACTRMACVRKSQLEGTTAHSAACDPAKHHCVPMSSAYTVGRRRVVSEEMRCVPMHRPITRTKASRSRHRTRLRDGYRLETSDVQ